MSPESPVAISPRLYPCWYTWLELVQPNTSSKTSSSSCHRVWLCSVLQYNHFEGCGLWCWWLVLGSWQIHLNLSPTSQKRHNRAFYLQRRLYVNLASTTSFYYRSGVRKAWLQYLRTSNALLGVTKPGLKKKSIATEATYSAATVFSSIWQAKEGKERPKPSSHSRLLNPAASWSSSGGLCQHQPAPLQQAAWKPHMENPNARLDWRVTLPQAENMTGRWWGWAGLCNKEPVQFSSGGWVILLGSYLCLFE